MNTWSRRAHDKRCLVPGCGEKTRRRPQLCEKHHARWRYRDKPEDFASLAGPRRQRPATVLRRLDRDGYVLVRAGFGQQAEWLREHRLLMEHHLGRPLRPDETVHHRNGDVADNRIENLEIWVKVGHPPGRRVEDLVAWAHEIIARYGRA